MTKQPWGPWQDCVESETLPTGGDLLVEYEEMKAGSLRNDEPFSKPIRYAQRLPEVVRTVDLWIELNGGYKTGLTTWSVGPTKITKMRSRPARITVTGEGNDATIKVEWV